MINSQEMPITFNPAVDIFATKDKYQSSTKGKLN